MLEDLQLHPGRNMLVAGFINTELYLDMARET